MSSLRLLKEDDRVALSMAASEYQKTTLLLDLLLVSSATSITRFCHILQDTDSHQSIGQMLVNGK